MSQITDKQYAKRSPVELDRDGGHYSRHVAAMTAEGLHSKSDIAAELAWRDMRIAELEESCAMACETPDDHCDCCGCLYAAEKLGVGL